MHDIEYLTAETSLGVSLKHSWSDIGCRGGRSSGELNTEREDLEAFGVVLAEPSCGGACLLATLNA